MYSRVTLLEIDTLRVEVEDVLRRFETEILPRVREMPGYEGVAVLVTPEGKGMIVSFWESEEAVEASAGPAASAVEEFVTLYRAPPGREHYRVAYAEMPRVTVET
ncbi:MAG: antibiotic biosynthesis monooxygenase [Gaiella sp.]|nr:antibiotic biosynthesis monooxygenase [Gaiella sp.]